MILSVPGKVPINKLGVPINKLGLCLTFISVIWLVLAVCFKLVVHSECAGFGPGAGEWCLTVTTERWS